MLLGMGKRPVAMGIKNKLLLFIMDFLKFL
jgi:hypothetical protein